MPLFVLVTLGLHLLLTLFMFYSGFQVNRLANRPIPTAVQLEGGRVIQQSAMPHDFRSADVIETVIKSWAIATLNWRSKTEQGALDAGKEIGNGRKVPSITWKSSFLLSEQDNFRLKFLQMLSQLIPFSVLNGQATTAAEIINLSKPQSAGTGRWVIDLVSNVLLFESPTAPGRLLFTFNKRVFIKAVPTVVNPLPEQATDVQRMIFDLRLAGLEIDEIQDLPS
jgi:hypothetical protein